MPVQRKPIILSIKKEKHPLKRICSGHAESKDANPNPMIIIQDYIIYYNSESALYFIKSNEAGAYCPICSSKMKVIGIRKRGIIEYYGEKKRLVIRRFYCKKCDRIHHELPDMIIPYKRYTSDATEKILSTNISNYSDYNCETSTLLRIKLWFYLLKDYFERALEAIKLQHCDDGFICKNIAVLMPLRNYTEFSAGWLRTLVRLLVNSNRWVHTRSAF